MRGGKLKQRISIERPVRTQDVQTGEMVDSWVEFLSHIGAEVLPDRAGEYFAARQVLATQNAMIRIRYIRGLDSSMRVRHHVRAGEEHVYDIEGIVHFQTNFEEIRLMCLRREAEGWRSGTDLQAPAA